MIEFYEWFKQANDIERKKCYTFIIQSMCLLPIKIKIKACYDIIRGIKYSRKITNKRYMDLTN